MAQSLLITLREGLEAALIVGIILAYLGRTGFRHRFASVWQGVAGAVAVSLGVGAILFLLAGEFTGRAEETFEGLAMLTAVAVLSYMVVWMKHQAANIRAHLEAQVRAVAAGGSAFALVLLSFVVVVREGLETALFLFAAAKTATPLQTTIGSLLGLSIAVALGYAVYRGSRRINLRTFFEVTGVLIVLFAGGLLARGIHELQEAALFPIVVEHVWNINPILDEKTGVGSFLQGLLGYNGNPSLLEVVFYVAYLGVAFWYFFRDRVAGRVVATRVANGRTQP